MILISNEDYLKVQQEAIEQGFGAFLKKLEQGDLNSSEFDEPKAYLTELLTLALVGYQNYINLYDYVTKITLNNELLLYFKEPHTKEAIRDFIDGIN